MIWSGRLSYIHRLFPVFHLSFRGCSRGKLLSLSWRGDRDGFGVRDFHDGDEDYANTLTHIEYMNGNTFGGFTPSE
jgi:hypothetical protein